MEEFDSDKEEDVRNKVKIIILYFTGTYKLVKTFIHLVVYTLNKISLQSSKRFKFNQLLF